MINQTRWRKSSRSGASANGCVELAHTLDAVRDSKNPTGPTLRIDGAALVNAAKNGNLNQV
ncbi:MAG TPA: DUF397 domain-containing protein [Actinophytocola sp.]|uniref:DUF397 domain-containing protein n=1 Tax=Actinophytocola sp. TaxID=1872138 RepID=UPI002DBBE458|nr:DUF397 domain-containing protein [Actinophytocola sp.]HEU5471114.1 DUF397 domain-containing protein [Actinophytocola sp.]